MRTGQAAGVQRSRGGGAVAAQEAAGAARPAPRVARRLGRRRHRHERWYVYKPVPTNTLPFSSKFLPNDLYYHLIRHSVVYVRYVTATPAILRLMAHRRRGPDINFKTLTHMLQKTT